ncbi:glycosyltransferase [Flavobacterium sp. 7A]|uniref:glycosyltransferase n=1 Tax=Flavobacterium sp. 7A TaxID=2940571 RepID=UPI002227FB8B|nr:glycosyltransferase [Flavobacterium sp. 7A]MCW2119417.1 glycosyltransferase involved in cell wall biosynthesis [Flavobacterium sp. 7A]
MKILQVINSLAMGGAEKLLLESIPKYKENGLEVDLLLLNGISYPFLEELKNLNCCNIYILGKLSVYNPLLIFKIIPYLKKYNLIHVHLFPAQYWVVLAKIFSFSRTKLIFTEHSTSNKRMQNLLFKPIEKFIYFFYIKIICITDDVKKILISHTGNKESKFIVIYNGVNIDKFKSAKVLPLSEIHNSLKEEDLLIIQVAGFREEKDQKTVIRSMSYLEKNVKLLLVGDGIMKKDCELLVQENMLEERVLFLGARSDVANLLKSVDISVVSSHWEGFGLVAVEGMASGIPVVASNVRGLSKVVDGAGVLFSKGDHRQLTKCINSLLENKENYNEIVEKGFERAKKYDINIMVEKTISLYMKYV